MQQPFPRYVIYRDSDGDFSWAYASDFLCLEAYKCTDYVPEYIIYDEPVASHACRLNSPDIDTDDATDIKEALDATETYIILRQDPIGGYDLDMSVIFYASYDIIMSRIKSNTDAYIKCKQFCDYYDEFYFSSSSLVSFESLGDDNC